MRLVAATAVSVLALSTQLAGADETARSGSSQPAPLPSWTGFYAGINSGGMWNSAAGSAAIDWSRLSLPGHFVNSAAFASIPQPNFGLSNNPGFIGGGQAGYNWRITNNIVVGVETDFQGVSGGGNNWSSGWASPSSTHSPNAIGSARGRAGYLVTPTLQVYGTGGVAYSR